MPVKRTEGRESRQPEDDDPRGVYLSQREELFCQHLVEGMTQVEAYAEAGYAADDGNAARLAGYERVRRRIAELRAPGVRAVLLTHREHLEKLAELRDRALGGEFPAYGAAVSAEVARGKCAGLYTDKVEHSGPDGGPIEVVDPKPRTMEELAALWQALHPAS